MRMSPEKFESRFRMKPAPAAISMLETMLAKEGMSLLVTPSPVTVSLPFAME